MKFSTFATASPFSATAARSQEFGATRPHAPATGRGDRRRQTGAKRSPSAAPLPGARWSCASRTWRGCRAFAACRFDLHEGEVLGLGGLVGAGRTELVRLIYGADRPDSRHACRLTGAPFAPRTPARRGEGRTGSCAGGAAGRRPDPREERCLQCRASPISKRIVVSPALPLISDRGAHQTRARDDPRAVDQDRRHRDAGRAAQRRQPAEGRHRPLVRVGAARPDPRRADARRRYRRARRDPPADPRARREGHGGARHFIGARRTARCLRPRARHGRGPRSCASSRATRFRAAPSSKQAMLNRTLRDEVAT